MTKSLSNRREFLADTGLAAAAVLCSGVAAKAAAESDDRLHVSINQWSVGAVRGRDKQNAKIAFDDELAGLAAAGINGLEPGLGSADQVDALAAQLTQHGLQLRSIYTGSCRGRPRQRRRGIGADHRAGQAGQGGRHEDHRDQSPAAPEPPGQERRATADPSRGPQQAGARLGGAGRHIGVPQP